MNQVIAVFGSLLTFFYDWTGDYGIAIVCLTVLVKLCLLPLYARQRNEAKEQQAGAGSCMLLLLTFPVMIGLYRSVLAGAGVFTGTRLCPWLVSLLSRDPCGILPLLSAAVQMIPQMYPYITFFQCLQLPKAPKGMLLFSAGMTLLICLPLPAGAGIYYLTSGMFSALEQGMSCVWRAHKYHRAETAG